MTIGIGHNLSGERLRVIVERIERLQQEIDATNADKREVFAEAKSSGFNVKTLKKVIQERRQDQNDRKEQLELFDLYWGAIAGATAKAGPRAPAPAPAREAGTVTTYPAGSNIPHDPQTGEITEPASGEADGGVVADGPDDETIAAPPEVDTETPSGGDPTREEEDDGEEEPDPEHSATEEATAAAAEDEPEKPAPPVADTWTCTGCGWVGMAAMVTDECPECGARTDDDEPGLEDIPDFLDRRGELAG